MPNQLLLHICCAPDEAWVIHSLHSAYQLHCLFCNPNISPKTEYEVRCAEAKKTADHYGVPFTADEYSPADWDKAVGGLMHTPEGGERCTACFLFRLRRTAAFCQSIGWQSFATVMSVSPHKKIAQLNEAGHVAAAEHGVIFVEFDFKKKDGFKKSIMLSKELGLYRQDYCGCTLSLVESIERKKKKAERTTTLLM